MEIHNNPIIERITPKKSVNDMNEYRILRLQNGLNVLIISTQSNDYEIDNTTSVSYSEKEGPHFLSFGATARSKNFADEVFYTTETKAGAKPRGETDEMQDAEMTPSDNEDHTDDDSDASLKDYKQNSVENKNQQEENMNLVHRSGNTNIGHQENFPLDYVDEKTLVGNALQQELDLDRASSETGHQDKPLDYADKEALVGNLIQQEMDLDITPSDTTGHQDNVSGKDSYCSKQLDIEKDQNEIIDETEIDSENEEEDGSDSEDEDGPEWEEMDDILEDAMETLDFDETAIDIFLEKLPNHPDMGQELRNIISSEEACFVKVTTDPVYLGYETIPLSFADIEQSNDEAGKLVFQETTTKSARNGMVSITLPVGALSDHSYLIGLADLSRKLIEDECIISVDTGFEASMTTVTHLCKPDQNVESCLNALLCALPNENMDKMAVLFQSNYPSRNSTCEIKNGLDLDSWMLSDKKQLQLLYSLSKDNHPFKSVSPDFYLALRKQDNNEKFVQFVEDMKDSLNTLWQEKYCVHAATIVVQSSESLDCLESIVVKRTGFSKCCHPNEEDSPIKPDNLESPFETQTFAKLYKVTYTGEENLEPSLVMSWALSPQLWKNYKKKPMEYIAWLISHKSEGGIYSTLHEAGWITDIQAGCNHTGYHRNEYISLFQIKIKLTNNAMILDGGIRLVVKTVFSYLNHLKAMGCVQQELYAALHFSRQIIFNGSEPESSDLRNFQIPFSHPASPIPRISALGEKMQMIPQENLDDLLTMDNFFEYPENEIENLLISLDIDACNFMLSCKMFGEKSEFEEVYYGTKYTIKDIPSKWKEINDDDVDLSQQFKLPSLNESLENSFNSGPLMFDDADFTPELVLQNEHVNLWKKSNGHFKKISAYIIHFAAPLLNNYSPDRAIMISILSKKLKHEVDKGLDTLKITNLRYSIEPSHIGILVKVFGFQSQSNHALEFILLKYKYIIAEDSRNPQKQNDNVKRELAHNYGTAISKTDILARCVYNTLSVRNYVPLMSRLNALEEFTCDRYKEEINLFQESCTTGMLALGCCSQMQMTELMTNATMELPKTNSGKIIKAALGKTEIFSYMWPLGDKIIRVVNMNMEKDTVHVFQHFQLQIATPETKAFAYLLLEIVNDEILMGRYLRNPIAIDARINEFNGVIDFELIGSASGLSACDATEFLDEFMGVVQRSIESSSENYKREFRVATTSLAIKRSTGKAYHSVINEFHEHERKIKDFSFAFDHIPLEAEKYATISRKDFYEWFSANFDEKIRKLTIQVFPMPDAPVVNDKKMNSKKTTKGSDDQIIYAPTGHILIKPGSTEKHPEKFIHDVQQFIGSLNLYTPSPLLNN